MLARIEALESSVASKSKMGTMQSMINVQCCSSQKEDEQSDDEREGTLDPIVPSVLSWRGENRPAEKLPRSLSSATTIPTHMQKSLQ